MSHAKAKLTPAGRLLTVQRVMVDRGLIPPHWHHRVTRQVPTTGYDLPCSRRESLIPVPVDGEEAPGQWRATFASPQ
jgi:hypothetical protein